MKVVTASEMREIDRVTIEDRGIPGEVLMALAGKAVADFAMGLCQARNRPIAVCCGGGNNGGDGFVAAYRLVQAGYAVRVLCIADPSRFTPSTALYHRACLNSGLAVEYLDEGNASEVELEGHACVIDAMTGTGFNGSPTGTLSALIAVINDADVPVIAVDMPSGLPSDGEGPRGEAVIADYTVTIGLPKISLVTLPGMHYSGTVHVADIGFPADLTGSPGLTVDLVDESLAAEIAAKASNPSYRGYPDSDKFSRGHVLVVGGFDGMEGAALMAASAALETGAGMVTLLTTPGARPIISGRAPEIITAAVPATDDPRGFVGFIESFLSARRYDCLLMGPGLGRDERSKAVFSAILTSNQASRFSAVVLDGDALYHLASHSHGLPRDLGERCLLTPHFGEASRLTGKNAAELKARRLESVRELALSIGASVLLKGPASITTDGLRCRVNTTGGPALSAAGSGDVLSGIASALVLRGLSCADAGAIAAFVHGAAGDRAGECGVLKATDILPLIRGVMSRIFPRSVR